MQKSTAGEKPGAHYRDNCAARLSLSLHEETFAYVRELAVSARVSADACATVYAAYIK